MGKSQSSRIIKRTTSSRNFWIFLILVIIFIVFMVINKLFVSWNNIKNIMYSISVSGIIMIGVGNLLISGNMDLSAGAVGCLAAILGAQMINAGVPWVFAAIVALLIGAACGAINALMTYQFGIMPFIGTLGISFVWKGLANNISKNTLVYIRNESFYSLGGAKLFDIPAAFLYVILLCVIYGLIMKFTKHGRKVYMCGGNRTAARLAGINHKKVGTVMMINCSVLASLAGIILASRMHEISPTNLQDTTTMSAITAALLGGIAFSGGVGNMMGAFLGLLLLNSFKNGLDLIGVNEYWQVVANGLLLCAAIVADYFNQLTIMRNLKKSPKTPSSTDAVKSG